MLAALIPPVPELKVNPSPGIHLVLSHLLEYKEYRTYYWNQGQAGDYVIMDNGAHELGMGQTHSELLMRCRSIGANEVVLPDVLFDRRGTVERTKQMLKWIIGPGWDEYNETGCPRCMVVPQGTDRSDWAICLKSLLQAWDFYARQAPSELAPPVIGVSKDYDDWRGGLPYLVGHYIKPVFDSRECDVHCLGWPSYLWSIALVARQFPWVRSTDSAKAFVYAKNGILLEPGGPVPSYPRRDPRYFNDPLSRTQRAIAKRNISVFRAAATDELVFSPVEEDENDEPEAA